MPETGRMYLCARCRAQVVVCRRCDRGQIYCDRRCAAHARGAAQRAAGQRYQSSRPGRFAHAARARRYRSRCKIVTHQGSPLPLGSDLLAIEAAVPRIEAVVPQSNAVGEALAVDFEARCCIRCRARCSSAVRTGFVRHRPLLTPTDARPAGRRPLGA